MCYNLGRNYMEVIKMAKKLSKTLSLILAITMILCTLPLVSLAADTVDSGKCGDDLTWTLSTVMAY